MKSNENKKMYKLTALALLIAIMLILSFTPLGYLNVGPLAITFNVIPVAIAAITLGPVGGAIIGGTFGLTSFLQCLGIGGLSAFGAALFEISPLSTIILCFVPRILDGFLIGVIFAVMKKVMSMNLSMFITGFLAAFLNTLFFMSLLVILFQHTEFIGGMIGGQNIILFCCAFVGVNAVVEMLAATIITGAVGFALYKAKIVTK